MSVNIFLQARMSSQRFPGKVLAPLRGAPLIWHTIERCRAAEGIDKVVVLTSADASDDPLAAYLKSIGCLFYRGVLDPVFVRYQAALESHPCDYFVRISGDSPLIEPGLITAMAAFAATGQYDFLSNVHHKKFPRGQSVEIVRSSLFASIDPHSLSGEEQEHVMPYFYSHSREYRTFFADSPVNNRHINCCVDTLEDMRNIEEGKIVYRFNPEDISKPGATCNAA